MTVEKETEMTDKEHIDEIFKTTNTESCPIAFYRLGSKRPDANRPIMLRMRTISEKEEFMSKLWMLGQLKMKLPITHDYTIDERKVIKEYVEEAKKRNSTSTKGYVWKVRGTPRNGMKLMKIQTQD